MNKNANVCNNCGKRGHMFHQCKLPITSYGIIAFRGGLEGIEYLMIRRKNSFGYIDFIRGKYSPYNLTQLKTMIDEMSLEEKEQIQTLSFDKLWIEMWGESNIGNNQYKNEENASKKKFELLKEGVIIDNSLYTLNDIVKMSKTNWLETEWEFPKGRRNQREKDLDCALREFQEETGISQNRITIVENLLPFEEIFIGSNHKAYKHKYFLALFNNLQNTDNSDNSDNSDELNNFQVTEVSKLEWKTLDKCLESIRPYNLEKKEIIQNINKVLQEYRLYS
jgi:8-oxo-dGTP pyrophosphatase MutT (NUDIX family)